MADANKFRFFFKSITFRRGRKVEGQKGDVQKVEPLEVEMKPGSVLLLVGPNRGGKTSALGDIQRYFQNRSGQRYVVQDWKTKRAGTADDFKEWLRGGFPSGTPAGEVQSMMGQVRLADVDSYWDDTRNLAGHFAGFLYHFLNAEDRLRIMKSVQRVQFSEHPRHYFHLLQRRPAFEKQFKDEVWKAFRVTIVRDDVLNEQEFGLRVYEGNLESAPDLGELDRLRKLDQGGHGLVSFVATILAAFCGMHPVLLIDEPEAFLHPPQARRLATVLSQSAKKRGRQVIMATHSPEVVQGALDGGASVSVCRIERKGDDNPVSVLPEKDVKQIMSDALLRSSAVITGMFHDAVVVCEADRDCRFYEAVLQELRKKEDSRTACDCARDAEVSDGSRGGGKADFTRDIHFVHGGGTGKLASLAEYYRKKLSMKTAVIADLDILRDKDKFKNAAGSLGGHSSKLEEDFGSTRSALDKIQPVLRMKDFQKRIHEELDRIKDCEHLETGNRSKLKRLVDETAKWSKVKKEGIALLEGEAAETANRLIETCREFGLFIVRVGELESWWSGEPRSNKAKWFIRAMEELQAKPSKFEEASKFVSKVYAYLAEGKDEQP